MITELTHAPVRGSFVAGWSRRRRWALAVALMVAFLCCGLATVPVAAFLDYTDRQGDPPTTAILAVDIYLNQLMLEEQIGLSHALISDRRDELTEQWETLIADMKRTDPPPSRLDWGPRFDVEDQGDEVKQVTVPVGGVWWQDRGMSLVGTEHPWVFIVKAEDGGWRIAEVQPHPWCGGHVRADACR